MPGPDAQGRTTTLGPLLLWALAQGRQQQKRYGLVLLQGGINDLGRGNKTASAVLPRLQTMIRAAAATPGVQAVLFVLPWPNRFVAASSDNERQRQLLVQGLRQWAAGWTGRSLLLLDRIASNEFDFWGRPQQRKYQDDALHLTVAGYDLLGGHVFGTLKAGGALPRLQAC